ncbi:MAG: reverse transcriptase-like protein [Candidatus Bathyarchaeia archaeon]
MITVYVKGLAKPTNPGVGTYGFAVYSAGQKVKEEYGFYKEPSTQNEATYYALRVALKWLLSAFLEKEPIIIKSDSRMLINQMLGFLNADPQTYYYKEYKEALRLSKYFTNISFQLIPRWQNEADGLAQKAYVEHCRKKGLSLKGPYNGVTRLMKRLPWINQNR